MDRLNIYVLEKCQRAGPWQGNTCARLDSKTRSLRHRFHSCLWKSGANRQYNLQGRGRLLYFSVIGSTRPQRCGVPCSTLAFPALSPVSAGRLPGKDEAASPFCAVEVELLQPCSALLCWPLLPVVKACGFSDRPALATLQRAVVL